MFDLIVGLDDVSDEQKARIFKKMGEADKVNFLVFIFCSSFSCFEIKMPFTFSLAFHYAVKYSLPSDLYRKLVPTFMLFFTFSVS